MGRILGGVFLCPIYNTDNSKYDVKQEESIFVVDRALPPTRYVYTACFVSTAMAYIDSSEQMFLCVQSC